MDCAALKEIDVSVNLVSHRVLALLGSAVISVLAIGCKHNRPPAAPVQAMPVKVAQVALNPVPRTDTYVATIKSRRSATMQPQVDGYITKILVKSGDTVKAGQLLVQIDPLSRRQPYSLRLEPRPKRRPFMTTTGFRLSGNASSLKPGWSLA